MRFSAALLLSLLMVLAAAGPARAEERPGEREPASKTLTGKERLGPKWTDEQRVDNCGVPPDKKGTKPRPDDCGEEPGPSAGVSRSRP